MKLYNLGNKARFSEIVEACGTLEINAESEKVHQFVYGKHAPQIDEPLAVRIHYKKSKPLPLPDFCRGTYLCFVSEHGKSVVEKHCAGFVEFSKVTVIGFGVDNGKSWSPAGLGASPFGTLKTYYVLHASHSADLLDVERTTIVKDTIGEMPELFPFGEFATLAFRHDVDVPPIFALPGLANLLLVSEEFVRLMEKEKVTGFDGTLMFDTSADFVFDTSAPETELISMETAIELAAVAGR